MRALVIGGTLFIGKAMVAQLRAAGLAVTVLHRGRKAVPAGVEELVADRNDPVQLKQALRGRTFDFVFDNVYDWERGTLPEHVLATIEALATQPRCYVFMSSVAVYPPGLDHSEDDPLAPETDPNPYVRNKVGTERALFRLHQHTGFPVVTIRPPFVYGPGNPFYREAFIWDRILDGRPVILPDHGERLMHFAYVDDVAWVAVRAGEVKEAIGKAFNVGNERPIRQAELVEILARIAGSPAKTVAIPREKILEAGGQVLGRNLYFGEYFDLPPITIRIDRARQLLGFQPTPFEQGLQKTFQWYLSEWRPRHKPDYSFEDRLLKIAGL